MIYRDFKGMKLSALGFGAMRLPLRPDGSGAIDEPGVAEMVRAAMDAGLNYFDTAYPYHGGQSERVLGRVLSAYPRERYYLASKYPGHQISQRYDPAAIFEEQLEKCGVDYFDFYLLHNVNDSAIEVYMDPKWGIVDYFVEQRRLGRIRHLGFSSHAQPENLRRFLDYAGDKMEFCQIQLNYLDWTLQRGQEKHALLTARGIPIWVMEPVRGGKLARFPEAYALRARTLCPGEDAPAWAFRWLMSLENMGVILSGMSDMAQLTQNLKTFEDDRPLDAARRALLEEIAESLKRTVPCTGCRYCCDGCPQGLDIPMLLNAYNDFAFDRHMTLSMAMEALPADKRPEACVGCGQCTAACPQGIDVPAVLGRFTQMLAEFPSWAEICREREAAQLKNRKA